MNKSETTLTKKDFEKVCLQNLKLNLKPDQPQEASTRYQIAIAYLMHQLQSQEKRSLFLLTLTYQIRSDFAPKQDLMNRNFKRFYCSFFLPFLFETKHYNTNKRILQQPITYSFLEEHKRKPHTYGAAPLHHHAIVAATDYQQNQVAGRGYIGLAALLFGNYRPGGLLAGAGLFGFADALQLRDSAAIHALLLFIVAILLFVAFRKFKSGKQLSAVLSLASAGFTLWFFFAVDELPGQLVTMTPYIATILVMALASQRLRMPAADGLPYRRGGLR